MTSLGDKGCACTCPDKEHGGVLAVSTFVTNLADAFPVLGFDNIVEFAWRGLGAVRSHVYDPESGMVLADDEKTDPFTEQNIAGRKCFTELGIGFLLCQVTDERFILVQNQIADDELNETLMKTAIARVSKLE